MQRTDFLELKYGAGMVIEPFLRRLFAEINLKTVYWISPWLTHINFRTATTKKLLQKLQLQSVNLVVITREPEAGSGHEEFVRDVKEMPTASIFYMPTLHAKFYVAETKERRYALLGSANMYEWSNRSYELGVVIEARGEGEVLIDKLESLAIDLRVTQHTTKA
tara:strand:+ start:7768 stop:8259 length:492 start_codon:yes stop_codon:yes gene_type:complete